METTTFQVTEEMLLVLQDLINEREELSKDADTYASKEQKNIDIDDYMNRLTEVGVPKAWAKCVVDGCTDMSYSTLTCKVYADPATIWKKPWPCPRSVAASVKILNDQMASMGKKINPLKMSKRGMKQN